MGPNTKTLVEVNGIKNAAAILKYFYQIKFVLNRYGILMYVNGMKFGRNLLINDIIIMPKSN